MASAIRLYAVSYYAHFVQFIQTLNLFKRRIKKCLTVLFLTVSLLRGNSFVGESFRRVKK